MNLQWLETPGGKMVVIIFMLVFIIGVVVLVTLTGHPLQEVGKELATGAISSLLTLLYAHLNVKSGAKE